MTILIGVDPGAVYTGVSVVHKEDDTVLLSSTYVKPEDTELFTWANEVTDKVAELVTLLTTENPDDTVHVGVEGVVAPRGYSRGKLSPINPKYLMFASVVAGAFARQFPQAVIVRPGNNGNNSVGYPPELMGRRPKTLRGDSQKAGTRNHERSAYDVAKAIPLLIRDNYILDTRVLPPLD